MARARIYRIPKPATQSGLARTHDWMLEFEPSPQRPDPLMGWAGGGDTQGQVRLRFDSAEEARAYADAAGLAYEVELPQERRVTARAYADNFKYGRSENWTH